MGLFDAFKGQKDVSLSKEEAVAGLLLIAVAADGVVEPEEMRTLLGIVIRIKALGRSNPDALFRSVAQQIQKFGMEKVAVAACEKIDAAQKKSVFLHFLDLLLSDGTVAAQEEKMALSVQEALGLDDAFVKNALELLAEKNKLCPAPPPAGTRPNPGPRRCQG